MRTNSSGGVYSQLTCALIAAFGLSCDQKDPEFASGAVAGAGATARDVRVSRSALAIANSQPLVRLDPADFVASSGAWPNDLSGSPITFTAGAGAAAPTLVTNGDLNSYPAVRFSGAQFMKASLGSAADWTGYTIVGVVKTRDALPWAGALFGSGGASNRDTPTAGVDWGHILGRSPGANWTPLRRHSAYVVSWKRSKNSSTSFVTRTNGVTTAIWEPPAGFPTGAFQGHLGAQSTLNGVPEYPSKFDLYELLVYKRELSESEIFDIESELGLKYGIAIVDNKTVTNPSQVPWEQISVGTYFGCGLRAGRLYCWGHAPLSAHGTGKYQVEERITHISRADDWTFVDAGYDQSCGIRQGQLYCWGSNAFGELGIGSYPEPHIASPMRVGTATDWTSVSGHSYHTCGIRAGGQLWCWGWNGFGQLGTSNGSASSVPVRVGTANDWQVVNAANNSTCGIRSGELYCWGDNASGQLGLGDQVNRSTPTRVGTLSGYQTVQVHFWRLLAIRAGELYTSTSGSLQRVGTLSNWTAIAMGGQLHMCGIESGRLFCWGSNYNGNLGTGDMLTRSSPTQIGTFTDWTAVSADITAYHETFTCGLRGGGVRHCWGSNSHYGFGNGVSTGALVPTAIADPEPMVQDADFDDFVDFSPANMAADGSAWDGTEGLDAVPSEITFVADYPNAKPTVVTGTNGRPKALRFAPGNMHASFGDTADWTGYTLTAVVKLPNPLASSSAIANTGGGRPHADDPTLDVRWNFGAGNHTTKGLGCSGDNDCPIGFGAASFSAASTYVLSWTRGGPGSGWTVRRNGAVVNSTPIADPLFPTSELHTYLGGESGDIDSFADYPAPLTYPTGIEISHLRIYKRQLGSGELGELEYRLGQTYGVNVVPPAHLPNGTGPCLTDADCAAGLTCGFGIGPRFGLPPTVGTCWDPGECGDIPPTNCGHFGAYCGPLCCTPDCPATGGPDGCGSTCPPCAAGKDSDGDSLLDCDERQDGDAWTDALVFNGVDAQRGNSCHDHPSCYLIDEASEVQACFQPLEERRQYSGWDFGTTADDICDAGYDFQPGWHTCNSNSAVKSRGVIRLRERGIHCFDAWSGGEDQCGLMRFNGDPVASTSAPVCYDLPPGVYPINWFYETTATGGVMNDFHVLHCFGDDVPCQPDEVIQSRDLRPVASGYERICGATDPCSDHCPCGIARECDPNAPNGFCHAGLECRVGIADRFNLAAATPVCWDPRCDDVNSLAFSCGTAADRCGTCPSCPDTCLGDQCGRACWQSCGATCDAGEAGCQTHADCAPGLLCFFDAGPQFGLGEGVNVCAPALCRALTPEENPCLDPDNVGRTTVCGVCPPLPSKCEDRECGPDGAGGECGPTPEGFLCNAGALIPAPRSPESTIFPVPPRPEPEVVTTEVGTLAGGFSVSLTGEATYRIPIRLPPGRGGMTPQLALSYSRNGGNGLLGVGWSLDGLATIARCNRTIAQDGYAAAVRLDEDDAFCMGGNRLIQVGSAIVGSERVIDFALENNDFSTIRAYEPIASAILGPERFEVTRPHGDVLTFGGTTESRVTGPDVPNGPTPVQVWSISKHADIHGNYIEYKYDLRHSTQLDAEYAALAQIRESGLRRELYPSAVVYSRHPTDPQAQNGVFFVYEDRLDKLDAWRAGANTRVTRRLKRVTVINWHQQRSYELDYGPTFDSRVRGVRECIGEGQGNKCLPWTTFAYDAPSGVAAPQRSVPMDDQMVQAVLDFDGDGRDDLLVLDGRFARDNVLLSRVSSDGSQVAFEGHIVRGGPHDDHGSALYLPLCGPDVPTPCTTSRKRPDLVPIDWDGDQRDDLFDLASGFVYRSTYDATGPRFERVDSSASFAGGGRYYALDVNGDSRPDVLRCSGDGDWRVAITGAATLSGWYAVSGPMQADGSVLAVCPFDNSQGGPSYLGAERFVQAGDIDGDGTQELLFIDPSRTHLSFDLRQPTYDLFVHDPQNPVAVPGPTRPSRDTSWQVLKIAIVGGGAEGIVRTTKVPWEAKVIDMNGDRLADFYQLTGCEKTDVAGEFCQKYTTPRVRSWLNTGSTFAPARSGDLRSGFYENSETPLVQSHPTGTPFSWSVTSVNVSREVIYPVLGGKRHPLVSRTVAGEVNAPYSSNGRVSLSATQTHALGPSTLDGAARLARVVDYDGDGRQDVLFPAGGAGWKVLWSLGDRFEVVDLHDPSGASLPVAWETEFDGSESTVLLPDIIRGWDREAPTLADVNGDGLGDIIKPTWNLMAHGWDDPTWLSVIIGKASSPRMIALTNGLGEAINIEYEPLAAVHGQLAYPCDYPASCKVPRVPVVSGHSVGRRLPNGALVDLKLEYDYSYMGARTDLFGRGFLGFGKTEIGVTPATSPVGFTHRTITEYDNRTRDPQTNLYYKAFVPETVMDTRNGLGVSHSTTITRQFDIRRPDPLHRSLFRYEQIRREVTSEQHGSSAPVELRNWVRVVPAVDLYGNPLVVKEGLSGEALVVSGGPEGSRHTTYAYMWGTENERNPDYDVPGRRSLVKLRTERFTITGSAVPWPAATPSSTDTLERVRHTGFDYEVSDASLKAVELEPNFLQTGAARLYRRTEFLRDDFGNVEKETSTRLPQSAASRIRQTVYGPGHPNNGWFPVEVVNEEGHRTALAFDFRYGTVMRATDDHGAMQETFYDGFGRIFREIAPDNSMTTVTYGAGSAANSLEIHVQVEGGEDTTTTYDVHGRPVATTTIAALDQPLLSETEYDDFDRPRWQTRPHRVGSSEAAARTVFEFDALGRPVKSEYQDTQPDGVLGDSTVEHCYRGLRACSRNARGFTSCRETDRVGRVTATWDPPPIAFPETKTRAELPTCEQVLNGLPNPSTRYAYGEVLEKVTDSAGNVTQIVPDNYGRTVVLSDPSTGIARSAWNSFGELEHTEDANGQVVRFEYDRLGRQRIRRDADMFGAGQDGVTEWFYDGRGPDGDNTVGAGDYIGLPSASVSPKGHVKRYKYDAIGQLTEVSQQLAIDVEPITVQFSDYVRGQASLIMYPAVDADGLLLRRTFDNRGNLISVRREGSPDAYWTLKGVGTYGQATVEDTGDGLRTEYVYDGLGRMSLLTNRRGTTTVERSLALTYDLNGNVTSRNAGSQSETATYDQLDRVRTLSINGVASVHDTEYDPLGLGNIKSRTGMGTYTYAQINAPSPDETFLNPTKPFAVTQVGNSEFGYDPAGNMDWRSEASGNVTRYRWTPFGKLADVWKNGATPETGVDRMTLDYDADEQRIVKQAGGVTTTYLEGLYERRAGSGWAQHVYYVAGATGLVAQLTLTDDGVAPPSSELTYIHTDHLGSPELLVTGTTTERRSYSAFGELRDPTDWAQSAGTSSSRLTSDFTGHERDPEHGLTHMIGRHYDAKLGRFLSADPFVFSPFESQGLNRYSYVRNNPLGWVDPTGYWEFPSDYGNSVVWLSGGDVYYEQLGSTALDMKIGMIDLRSSFANFLDGLTSDPDGMTSVMVPAGPDFPGVMFAIPVPTENAAAMQQFVASQQRYEAAGSFAAGAVFLAPFAWEAAGALAVQFPTAFAIGQDWALAEAGFAGGAAATVMLSQGGGKLASTASRGAAEASNVLLRTGSQLASKFKHAKDFGVAGNYSKANASAFSRAIHQHINSPAVRAIEGTYHRAPATHYLDPSTGLNVISDRAGNFISGWKLSPDQLKNVLTHGGL